MSGLLKELMSALVTSGAERLVALLVRGRKLDDITIDELLDAAQRNRVRRLQALERARKATAGNGEEG